MRSKVFFITIVSMFGLVLLLCQPCIGDPFPPGHPDEAVSDTFAWGSGSSPEEFNIYMWRENYAVWIEIEIIDDDHPFICSSSFVIIQNNIQFDTVELLAVSDDSQCGNIFIDSVFQLSQWSFFNNPADLNHDFTLLFDGIENTYTIDMVYDSQPPVADAGPDQAVDGKTTVSLDASDSYDPDGDTLSYFWESDTYLDITLSNANSMKPTFVAPEAFYYFDQTITFQLTVADGTFKATDTVDIVVNEKELDINDGDDGGGGGGGGGCFIDTLRY